MSNITIKDIPIDILKTMSIEDLNSDKVKKHIELFDSKKPKSYNIDINNTVNKDQYLLPYLQYFIYNRYKYNKVKLLKESDSLQLWTLILKGIEYNKNLYEKYKLDNTIERKYMTNTLDVLSMKKTYYVTIEHDDIRLIAKDLKAPKDKFIDKPKPTNNPLYDIPHQYDYYYNNPDLEVYDDIKYKKITIDRIKSDYLRREFIKASPYNSNMGNDKLYKENNFGIYKQNIADDISLIKKYLKLYYFKNRRHEQKYDIVNAIYRKLQSQQFKVKEYLEVIKWDDVWSNDYYTISYDNGTPTFINSLSEIDITKDVYKIKKINLMEYLRTYKGFKKYLPINKKESHSITVKYPNVGCFIIMVKDGEYSILKDYSVRDGKLIINYNFDSIYIYNLYYTLFNNIPLNELNVMDMIKKIDPLDLDVKITIR